MATTVIDVTTAWTLVSGSAGQKKFNVTNRGGTAVEYSVAAALPLATARGNLLLPGCMFPVDVPSGQNLYHRTLNGAISSGHVTIEDVV